MTPDALRRAMCRTPAWKRLVQALGDSVLADAVLADLSVQTVKALQAEPEAPAGALRGLPVTVLGRLYHRPSTSLDLAVRLDLVPGRIEEALTELRARELITPEPSGDPTNPLWATTVRGAAAAQTLQET